MRISLLSLIIFPLVLSFTIPNTKPNTSNDGPSVQGSFEIVLEGGEKRIIEFHANRGADGTTTGETTFRDLGIATAPKPVSDEASDTPKTLFMKADVDCLIVENDRAVMSGSIVESSWTQYMGRRVLVVAQEDRVRKGSDKRDRLTWGVYRNTQPNWMAQDQERPDEPSALAWIATDAERPDDEGTPSNKETIVGCQTFPLSSFSFFTTKQSHGNVSVKP